jgi:Kef-type K+ transport system membrane component KefB
MIVLQLLVALVVIVATTRLVGYVFQRIDQPAVIGELVGGILLGPSLLGWVAPEVYAALLPPAVMPLLRLHAQAGVIFFMFLVGLELDGKMIRQSSRTTIFISHASIILPFALGYGLAHALYPRLSPPGVQFTPFALFIGVSMSITAFPVLARILRDRGLNRTRMGNVAMACAAVDDVTAWCLLALVISISEFGDWGSAITHMPGVVAGHLQHYAIFAAFLAGALMPKKARRGGALHDRLARILALLFLPVFFAFSGIRTHIGLIDGLADWGVCAAIIAVACAGKFGGSVTAARLTGLGWRDSAALGVLMNTRGLVELVVLNIGLDLGVISPTLFTMLVVMALVTTFMTSPLLQMLLRNNPWTSEVRVNVDQAVRSA